MKSALYGYGYFGNYTSWAAASEKTGGYGDVKIFDRVLQSTLLASEGKVAFERDARSFSSPEYDYPILASLFWVASARNNALKVLDFGGALGSHYFQHRKMLARLQSLSWKIVEQHHFVEAGRHKLQTERLRFYFNIEEAEKEGKSDIILLGCVLPYLSNPYEWLNSFKGTGVEYILIDKHPVIDADEDRLTVQKVNPKIYSASYPAWFFSEKKFLDFMLRDFELIHSYLCPDLCNIRADFKGYLFRRKQ